MLEGAFPGPDEARLVERLRANRDVVIALVAERAGMIVGYVAFSRMEAPFPALGLAPVAVAADCRRQGIADRLIRTAIEMATDKTDDEWAAAFVLGDPAYYGRFGFSVADAEAYECAYAGPYFMMMPIGQGSRIRHGRVDYAPAFSALGSDQ